MHRLFSAFFWGVVGLALTAGVAAQVELSRAFYELSPEVVTPHIPWAKPLAGGPIKALFLGPRAGQRETLELAQRLSLNWRTVLLYSRTQLGANPQGRVWERAIGAFEEDVKAQLQEALRGRYEVILLGNFDARRFPREVEYALLQQVHDGTGLVYAYADFGQTEHFKQAFSQAAEDVSQQFVTTGVPLAALPAFAEAMAQGKTAEDFVSCRQFKKGRVVLLTYPGGAGRTHFLTPNPPATGPYSDLYYEYYQSLLIKAVLWAARRVPAVTFADFPATLTFPRTAWPGPQLAFHLANRGPERSLEVEFTLRSPQGRVWARKRQPLRLGPKGASVAWPLPRLSGGRYFADVRLTENGQALNWATTAVRVESEVAFARLSVNPPSIEAGWPVTVQAELREGAPEVTAVAVEVVDARGRIVWRGSAPVPPGEKAATLRVRVAEPRAIVHWVRAALSVQGEVVDRAETSFSVVRREWDDVAFCLWPPGGGPHEFVHRQVLRTLRRYGVDTLTNCSTNPDFARAAFEEDLRAIPYMTRYFFTGAPEDRIRRPCLTEPQYRAAEERKLTTNAQVFAPHDPLGYTLGDECYFNSQPYDLCWSETCLADFRRYLREVYGTVERLNAEWGTNLQSFAEATPLPLEEARQTGQFARWVDHRLHVDSVFAAMLAFARDVIRRTDPQARVGFDGAFGTNWHNGYDWWKLMQEFSLCNVYFQQSEQVEAVRSFAQPGTLIGFWYGGYMYGGFFGAQRKEEAFERFAPWYTLLHGGQSIWWFAAFGGTYGGSTEVAISPSLTPYPCFQWTAEEVRAIKSGLGKLLLHTERQQDGLAVLYSQPSLYAATLQPEFGSHVQALRGALHLLEDLGLQYDFVSYAQVAAGELRKGRYRVLILPLALALSPAEAAAVREFAAQGGLVLADVRPGRCDEHGKPQSPGLLDDLFGLRWPETRGKPQVASVTLKGRVGAQTIAATLPQVTVDAPALLHGAQALGGVGGTPVGAVRTVGRGTAVCLNFAWRDYERQRFVPEGRAWRQVVGALLAAHGVRPSVVVQTVAGEEVLGVEIVRYRDGAAEYVALLKRPVTPDEGETEAAIDFGTPAHLYDARSGKYLGFTRRVETTLRPGWTPVWARLPYSVRGILVAPRRGRVRAGETFTVGLMLDVPEGAVRHCVRVEVFSPKGKPVPVLARNVLLSNGRGEVRLPLAYNDPPGVWTVTARDVASGATAKARFRVL